jgi:hypothetical protein
MLLYTKSMHILKLLLNIVTTRIEAVVISGKKFMYACVRAVGRLWAQSCFDTFCQLLVTVEALWSQPALQEGKQVVVAQSEIRAGRRVVRQLPVEMLQQCSSASSCMRTCIVMEKHCAGCQHSMPFVLNGPMQFILFHNTKCGWTRSWHTSWTQTYKNLFLDMTSATIPAATMLRLA